MGDTVLWCPKGRNKHTKKFKKWWFGPSKIQNYLPNNIVLLVNIDNFEPNPISMNINKLKPYLYLRQALKGSEATIKGGGEHKEDLENKNDV
jgi:hypothetical protein